VAEAWEQFGIPEEGERPPLESDTRVLVNTEQTGEYTVPAVVN
jgi:hypothetical protein